MFRLRQSHGGSCKGKSAKLGFETLEDRCTPSSGHAFGHVAAPFINHGRPPIAVAPPLAPIADVSVTIFNNVAIAAQGGDSVVFNVTLVNNGPSAATVSVQTASSGVKDLIWAAGSNGQDLGLGSGDVSLSVPLAAGQTAVVTLWGHIAIPQGIASMSVTASPLGASDPNLSNNMATSGIIVV